MLVLLAGSILLAAAATLKVDPSQAEKLAPDIVARVNGEVVTSAELRRVKAELLERRRLQGQAGDEGPDAEALETLAVQNLIQRHLMLQEAAQRKIAVSNDELDQAITALRRRFADLKGFGTWMEERGLDDATLIETIRGDILTRLVFAALAEEAESATESQVEEYYAAHKEDLAGGEEVRLRIIVMDSAEAGDAVLTALGDGISFDSLARQVSRGQRAAQGGDTGWMNVQALPPQLRQVVGKLKEGEAYGPIEKNPDEFMIVALAGRRHGQARSLDEVRPDIERHLLTLNKRQAMQAWLSEQEAQADIEVFL